jgi:hypothetical protein
MKKVAHLYPGHLVCKALIKVADLESDDGAQHSEQLPEFRTMDRVQKPSNSESRGRPLFESEFSQNCITTCGQWASQEPIRDPRLSYPFF